MIKRLITLLIIVITLSGCGINTTVEETVEKQQYNFNESFVKLQVQHKEEMSNINIQTDEIFEIELKQEAEIDIPNENEQYKDVVESNIEVNAGEIDINFRDYSWFEIPTDVQVDYYSIYQYIIYGIDKYYNGEVKDTFTSRLPDDIFDETTNMIFKVKVYGEQIDLVLSLDTFNNNIRVEEVQK